jgi:hypothetical protein
LPTQLWTNDSAFYLPLIGCAIGVVALPRRSGAGIAVAVFAFLTFQHSATWSSPVALFGPVAARYGTFDPRALNRLAHAYFDAKDDRSAASTFIELDELHPEFPYNRAQRAWAFSFVGAAAGAEDVLTRCLEASDRDCAVGFCRDVLRQRVRASAFGAKVRGDIVALARPALTPSELAAAEAIELPIPLSRP